MDALLFLWNLGERLLGELVGGGRAGDLKADSRVVITVEIDAEWRLAKYLFYNC